MFSKFIVRIRRETAEQTSALQVFQPSDRRVHLRDPESLLSLFLNYCVRPTPGRWVCEARTLSASCPEVCDIWVGCRLSDSSRPEASQRPVVERHWPCAWHGPLPLAFRSSERIRQQSLRKQIAPRHFCFQLSPRWLRRQFRRHCPHKSMFDPGKSLTTT